MRHCSWSKFDSILKPHSIIFGPIFIRYEVEDLHNALASCSLGNNFAKLLIAYAPEFIVRPECVVPFEPSLSRMYQESLPERSSSLRLFGGNFEVPNVPGAHN